MAFLDGIKATARILTGTGSCECTSDHAGGIPHENPKVSMLTTVQRDEAVIRAIHAGAEGFIMKDTTPEFVLAPIRIVYAGHSVIARSDTADLIRSRTSRRYREPAAE